MLRLMVLAAVWAALACFGGGCAQEAQTMSAPAHAESSSRQPPELDPARGEPVAVLRGKVIDSGDLEGTDLHALIARPLIEEFIRENRLEPTAAQLRSFEQWFSSAAPGMPESPESQEARREIAHAMVQQWLVSKAMYERYGGAVIFQQANPMEPVGAYRRFFEEHEARGTFKILNEEEREAFWSYYTREHPMQVPEHLVDFSRPWWEQAVR